MNICRFFDKTLKKYICLSFVPLQIRLKLKIGSGIWSSLIKVLPAFFVSDTSIKIRGIEKNCIVSYPRHPAKNRNAGIVITYQLLIIVIDSLTLFDVLLSSFLLYVTRYVTLNALTSLYCFVLLFPFLRKLKSAPNKFFCEIVMRTRYLGGNGNFSPGKIISPRARSWPGRNDHSH